MGYLTDLSQLEEMSNGDQSFIKEMIGIFLEDTPVYISELKSSVATQDWEETSRVAHKMKSSIRVLGAEIVVNSLIKLEFLKDEPDTDQQGTADEHLKFVDDKVELILAELKGKLQALA